MPIDKGLYQAPTGLETLGADEENRDGIEIEIVDPEAVNIKMDGLEIELGQADDDFNENLAETLLSEAALSTIASELGEAVDNDKMSRKEWEKMYVEGVKLLGLQIEERTEPWNGACGVFHPMLAEAVVRFQSETITETFPAQGPVRTKIIGKETPEVLEAAARVEEDMNFELTEVMTEYRPEHERMLWSLPATGSAFKKVYFDPNLGRQVAMFIPAEDVLLPYGASDLDTCHRVTHEMRKTENDIRKLQAAGFYVDAELGAPQKVTDDIQKAKDKETGFSDINDDRYTLYEVHADLYIEDDPHADTDESGEHTRIALPYVVTLIKGTNTILSIRRNWKEDDPLKLKRQHFVHYQYIPGFGAYGFGLFHLIGGFAKNATSIMRQLVDAGTLSNLPGGLKSRGLRIKGDDTPIAPGEWRDVDVASGNIRDSILPLPYKEPSAVLAGLLGTIVDEGRRFAATADLQVSDMSANSPVGSTLAILERQLKVMTAVQARVHNTLKRELKLIKEIIRDYAEPDYEYTPEYGSKRAKKEDYDKVDLIPVSDPNAATLSQRVVQYQAVLQLAQGAPQIYDMPFLHRQMLDILGIKNAEKIVPLPDDQKPKDPVSENMAIMTLEPVKAFLYQNHQAHIAVHQAMMQDPMIQQNIGQNPQAPQIMAALQAHIAEHTAFAYRQQVEQQMGIPLPPEDEKLPPEFELALSTMMARAAQQLLQQNQAVAAQQQAQQQMQDPIIQMQMQELQIKQQELQIKQQEVQTKQALAAQEMQLKLQQLQVDAANKADALQLKEQEMHGRFELESMKVGADIEHKKTSLQAQQEKEGMRMGVEIARDKERSDLARKQAALKHLAAYKGKKDKAEKPAVEKPTDTEEDEE